MEDTQTIAAEAPVPVVLAKLGDGYTVYPLTPCCHATGKGWLDDDGAGVVCRACFEWVDDLFGMCWPPQDQAQWRWYTELLVNIGETPDKATQITQHVHNKVLAALGGAA